MKARELLGATTLLYGLFLLVAIPPTRWMLAIWLGVAAAGTVVGLFIAALSQALRPEDAPRRAGPFPWRAAAPPLAAAFTFIVLAVQGADLEVHETTEVRDYWLLAIGMVLSIWTLMVSYERSRFKQRD
ncbi:MAG: hypothetical protein ACPGQL_05655 [Thermoplasmatota archaeon]